MRSVSAGGGTGRDVSSAGRCGAGVARNSDCREGFDLSSGERARPGSAVLRGLVVRSVSTGGGFRGCTIVIKRQCAAGVARISACRDGIDVSSGERARPDSAVLRGLVVRTVSAAGVSGCASSSSKCSALLLCPTTGSTGLVHMCVVAFRHPHAPLS